MKEWFTEGWARLRDGVFLSVAFLFSQIASEVYRLLPVDFWSQIPNTALMKLIALLVFTNLAALAFIWARRRFRRKLGIYWSGKTPMCPSCRIPMVGPTGGRLNRNWICLCPGCKTEQELEGRYESMEEILARLDS